MNTAERLAELEKEPVYLSRSGFGDDYFTRAFVSETRSMAFACSEAEEDSHRIAAQVLGAGSDDLGIFISSRPLLEGALQRFGQVRDVCEARPKPIHEPLRPRIVAACKGAAVGLLMAIALLLCGLGVLGPFPWIMVTWSITPEAQCAFCLVNVIVASSLASVWFACAKEAAVTIGILFVCGLIGLFVGMLAIIMPPIILLTTWLLWFDLGDDGLLSSGLSKAEDGVPDDSPDSQNETGEREDGLWPVLDAGEYGGLPNFVQDALRYAFRYRGDEAWLAELVDAVRHSSPVASLDKAPDYGVYVTACFYLSEAMGEDEKNRATYEAEEVRFENERIEAEAMGMLPGELDGEAVFDRDRTLSESNRWPEIRSLEDLIVGAADEDGRIEADLDAPEERADGRRGDIVRRRAGRFAVCSCVLNAVIGLLLYGAIPDAPLEWVWVLPLAGIVAGGFTWHRYRDTLSGMSLLNLTSVLARSFLAAFPAEYVALIMLILAFG